MNFGPIAVIDLVQDRLRLRRLPAHSFCTQARRTIDVPVDGLSRRIAANFSLNFLPANGSSAVTGRIMSGLYQDVPADDFRRRFEFSSVAIARAASGIGYPPIPVRSVMFQTVSLSTGGMASWNGPRPPIEAYGLGERL